MQKLAREKSLTSLRALIGIVEDVDANGIPNQDGRVVVVAAQTVLTWAYGKPPEYDPREDRPPMAINLAVATAEEKRLLLALLRRGLVTEAPTKAETAPNQIEGSGELAHTENPSDKKHFWWRESASFHPASAHSENNGQSPQHTKTPASPAPRAATSGRASTPC